MQLVLMLCLVGANADPTPKDWASRGIGLAGRFLTAASALAIRPECVQIIGGVNNVMSNWDGIRAGEGRQREKLLTACAMGMVSGAADWGNLMTFGAFHDGFAVQSAKALASSYNVSFDKNSDDTEAYAVSYHVLSKMYSYGPQGSWAKIGGDIQWNHHLFIAGEVRPSQRYSEARSRFRYMDMKMRMAGSYANPILGNNRTRGPGETQWHQGDKTRNYYGHWALGRFLGPKLMYYGFEVWGEPYVEWEIDDYYDDGNPLTGSPMDGSYDTRY
jgi:hypothetical protein